MVYYCTLDDFVNKKLGVHALIHKKLLFFLFPLMILLDYSSYRTIIIPRQCYIRGKPLMNSPGLQAGDQKAHTSPPATRRPLGGEWRGKKGFSFLSLGLKAGAIHECTIIEIP
jgi:hypothetical protein